LPLDAVRRRIWEQACELAVTGDVRDLTAVLANRFQLSRRVIHLTLIAEGMRHERTAASLRNGIVNALAMAREDSSAVAEELAEGRQRFIA